MHKHHRLGDVLLASGVISQAQLETAVEAISRSHRRLGEVIVVFGFATESDVTRCLAEEFGVKVANLAKATPTPDALQVMPSHLALTRSVLPVEVTTDAIHVIISDPFDLDLIQELQQLSGLPVVYSIAPPSKLKAKIERAYQLPCLKVRSEISVKRPFKNGTQPDRDALLSVLENFGSEPISSIFEIPAEISVTFSSQPEANPTEFSVEEASSQESESNEIAPGPFVPELNASHLVAEVPIANNVAEEPVRISEAPILDSPESPTSPRPLEALSDEERLSVELATLATELSLATLESINAEAA